jgi:hypothetical protein
MNVIDSKADLEYFLINTSDMRREKRMAAHKFRFSIPMMYLVLIMIAWIAPTRDAQGGTLYQYIDKDGSVVLTDNPPPGVKAKPMESLPDMTGNQKSDQEKEADSKTQQYREADAKIQEKREKIRALREEIETAQSNEEKYRSNMNQAHGFAQRSHWRKLVDEQLKEIEEKKKKIEELESQP